MTQPDLFGTELDAPVPALDETRGMSADRARTIRQRRAIENGKHPLGLVFPGISVHLEVLVGGATYTCGDCRFRETVGHRSRSYPKCLYGAREVHRVNHEGKGYAATEYPRVSHGAATDVRAHWPACQSFEVAE